MTTPASLTPLLSPVRKKPPRRFRLTDRDIEIIHAVNRYRYLRTGQIQRLLFPENGSIQSCRRRLRNLSDLGHRYLAKIEPYVQIGKGSAETAYYLDKQGEALLKEFGNPLISYTRRSSGQVKHHFLDHALDLSEFRLVLERALLHHSTITLHRFTADFEIKEHTQTALGKKSYKLYHELIHPHHPQPFIVYPDALIILAGKDEHHSKQRLYFLEIDRGTEGMKVIRNKVIGYALYSDQRVFAKFGKFARFRVLIQTHSEKRTENMRKALIGTQGESLVWITSVPRVTEETLLHASIWEDTQGQSHPILKTAPTVPLGGEQN